MSARRTPVLFAFASLIFVGSHAAGAPLDVDYDVPEQCPSKEDFLTALRSRVSEGYFSEAERRSSSQAGDSVERPSVVVRISGDDEETGYNGTIHLKREQERSSDRHVTGASCDEVVDALAVVAAIALEDERRTEPSEAPREEGPGEDPPEPSKADSVEPEGTVEIKNPKPENSEEVIFRGSTPLFRDPPTEVETEAGTIKFDTIKSVTITGGVLGGWIPGVALPTVQMTLHTASFTTTPDGQQFMNGTVVPAFRLGMVGPTQVGSEEEQVDIVSFFGGASLCLAPTYNSQGWVALVCPELSAGLLLLDGQGSVGVSRVGIWADLTYNLNSWFHLTAQVGGYNGFGNLSVTGSDGDTITELNAQMFEASAGIGFQW